MTIATDFSGGLDFGSGGIPTGGESIPATPVETEAGDNWILSRDGKTLSYISNNNLSLGSTISAGQFAITALDANGANIGSTITPSTIEREGEKRLNLKLTSPVLADRLLNANKIKVQYTKGSTPEAQIFEEIGINTGSPTLPGSLIAIKTQINSFEKNPTVKDILAKPVWLAFSGGGFNSHSFLSGMFAGAFDKLENAGTQASNTLSKLMRDVEGIGANSGGAWFLTHLAYAPSFFNSLGTKASRDAYTTSGYYGALRNIAQPLIPAAPPSNVNNLASEAVKRILKDFLNIDHTTFGVSRAAYNTLLQRELQGADNTLKEAIVGFASVTGLLGFLGVNGRSNPSWRKVMEDSVYKPLGMLTSIGSKKFGGNVAGTSGREPWAANKDLVIAAGLPTAKEANEYTVLHADNDILAEDRVLGKIKNPYSRTTSLANAYAIPLFMRSLAGNNVGSAKADLDSPLKDLTFKYKNDKILASPSELEKPVTFPLNADKLGVIDVATASSSAGAIASHTQLLTPLIAPSELVALGITGIAAAIAIKTKSPPIGLLTLIGGLAGVDPFKRRLASWAKDFSPIISFNSNNVKAVKGNSRIIDTLDSVQKKFQEASDNNEMRVMDGGYLDNTAAAGMVRRIQQTQTLRQNNVNPFELMIVVNSNDTPSERQKVKTGTTATSLSTYKISNDTSYLFGVGKGTGSGELEPGQIDIAFEKDLLTGLLRQGVPSRQIFKANAWLNELNPEWKFNQGDIDLQYFKLDVETVSNKEFGVRSGYKGVVHIFENYNKTGFAAPRDRTDLDRYDTNFAVARDAFSASPASSHLLDIFNIG